MALDSGNVTVAVTGAVSLGTASATSPTDADTVLGTGWTDLGYCSEAGIVEARSRSTNAIKAWQNASIVRTVVTEAGATWAVTFIESKQEVVELFYSDTVDASGAVDVNPGLTGGAAEVRHRRHRRRRLRPHLHPGGRTRRGPGRPDVGERRAGRLLRDDHGLPVYGDQRGVVPQVVLGAVDRRARGQDQDDR
jgi:hypothetical protein